MEETPPSSKNGWDDIAQDLASAIEELQLASKDGRERVIVNSTLRKLQRLLLRSLLEPGHITLSVEEYLSRAVTALRDLVSIMLADNKAAQDTMTVLLCALDAGVTCRVRERVATQTFEKLRSDVNGLVDGLAFENLTSALDTMNAMSKKKRKNFLSRLLLGPFSKLGKKLTFTSAVGNVVSVIVIAILLVLLI